MINNILAGVVSAIVGGLVSNPTIPVNPQNATVVADQVQTTVNNQLGPILENATNQERWYQSRVTLGNIVGIIASITSVFGFAIAPEEQDVIVGVVTGGAAILGGIYSLYGRWAKRFQPALGGAK